MTAAELLLSLASLDAGTAAQLMLSIEAGGGGDVFIGPSLAASHVEASAVAERVGAVLSASNTAQTTSAQTVSQTLTATAITQENEASYG